MNQSESSQVQPLFLQSCRRTDGKYKENGEKGQDMGIRRQDNLGAEGGQNNRDADQQGEEYDTDQQQPEDVAPQLIGVVVHRSKPDERFSGADLFVGGIHVQSILYFFVL